MTNWFNLRFNIKAISVFILATFLFPFNITFANAELKVDENASSNNKPKLDHTHNGIPIVNIVKPDDEGLSHNKFKEYNVDELGIIFNNNNDLSLSEDSMPPNSVLAGIPILINENLANGNAASIILAEVNGFNPSIINGITEIYGKGADFILANPNGIYCNGAGFINANRVTLTTGNPFFQRGHFRGFSIAKGKVTIKGNGVSTNVNDLPSCPIDIISRVSEIYGEIRATNSDVNIYTGANDYDYHDKTIKSVDGHDNDKPIISIDASLLGQVNANKISVIANEKGVGVNMPDLYAYSDNIHITADGNIELKKAHTNKELIVNSNNGNITQKVDNEQKDNNEQKGDSEQAEPSLFGNKHISLNAPNGDVEINSVIAVNEGGKLSIHANNFIAEQEAYLLANSATFNINNSFTNHGYFKLNSLDSTNNLLDIINLGGVQVKESLTLSANSIYNNGFLGSIEGALKLELKEQILNDENGTIFSKQKLGVEALELLNNGDIKTADDSSINVVSHKVDNDGNIYSGIQLDITTSDFTNHENSQIIANDLLTVKSFNEGPISTFINKGSIACSNEIKVDMLNVENWSTGSFVANGSLFIACGNTSSSDSKFLNEGKIYGGQLLKISANEVENVTGDVQFTQEDYDDESKSDTNTNNKAELASYNKILINSNVLSNDGDIKSNDAIDLNIAKSVLNTGNVITKNLYLNSIADNEHIKPTDEFINNGIVLGGDTMQLNVVNLENKVNEDGSSDDNYNDNNSGYLISPLAKLNITGSIDNTGICEFQRVNIVGTPIFINEGIFKTKESFALDANNFANDGVLICQESLKLTSSNEIFNGTSGKLFAIGNVNIAASNINNKGTIEANGGEIDVYANNFFNNVGNVISSKNFAIDASKIDNATDASIFCGKELSLISKTKKQLVDENDDLPRTSLTNDGTIYSVGKLNINLGGIQNTDNGIITSEAGIELIGEDFSDSSFVNTGKVASEGNLIIDFPIIDNKKSDIAHDKFGQIASNGALKMMPKEGLESTFGNRGIVYGGSGVKGSFSSVINKGSIISPEEVNLYYQGIGIDELVNQGRISSSTCVDIGFSKIKNLTNGELTSNGTLFFTKGNNSNEVINYSLDNDGVISCNDDLKLLFNNISNDINGQIASNKNIYILHNDSGDDKFVNKGEIKNVGDELTIQFPNIHNTANAKICSNGNLSIGYSNDNGAVY